MGLCNLLGMQQIPEVGVTPCGGRGGVWERFARSFPVGGTAVQCFGRRCALVLALDSGDLCTFSGVRFARTGLTICGRNTDRACGNFALGAVFAGSRLFPPDSAHRCGCRSVSYCCVQWRGALRVALAVSLKRKRKIDLKRNHLDFSFL